MGTIAFIWKFIIIPALIAVALMVAFLFIIILILTPGA